jgi:hypothetical protein
LVCGWINWGWLLRSASWAANDDFGLGKPLLST